MLQGLQNEDSIAEAFINKLDSEGKKEVSITKCGFCISKTHGFLGASPDGIITDEEERTPGVVEFKYIQVKPGETLTDVLLKQHICLKGQQNNTVIIQLNKNHKHYFQLYQKMFVTEYYWGVLIAQGIDGGLSYEKVKFTEEFWSPILKKNELFWHIPCLWTCLSKSSTWTRTCCLLEKLCNYHYIQWFMLRYWYHSKDLLGKRKLLNSKMCFFFFRLHCQASYNFIGLSRKSGFFKATALLYMSYM